MKDDLVKEAVRAIKENGTPPMKSSLSDWEFNDGLLFFNKRCYVPQDVKLRREITRRYHESITTGHPGQFQTIELIRRDYWWPGMTMFIRNYVAGCATCQQMKVNTHPTAPPLLPIKSTATRPFELVTTDFITDLPENDGFDSVMVVVDHGLTKGVIFIPCSKTVDALGSANLYLQHVYARFGLPDKIISDRDPRFASNLYQELGKLLGVKLAMSTAYHPQTDGETERVNQELEIYLQMLCSNNPKTWKQYLPTAEFAHNQKFHSSVKNTPFFLMMGSNPRALPLAYPKTNVPAAEQRISQLQ
jgi:Integrase zinc binding domain